jgi:hypothetical protein
MLNAETIAATVIGAVVGGAGIVGFVFAYMRRFIDKRLDSKDSKVQRRKDLKLERLAIEDEMNHATGRLFYFIHKYIESTGYSDPDFNEAWESYQIAEKKKKDLDRRILVDAELDE